MRGKVTFYDTWSGNEANGWKFSYRENCRSTIAVFEGFTENPPLCTLISDSVTPITGGNFNFVTEVVREYGKTLMFEPVGLEFLYSNAVKPQVTVEVDGIPALCMNLNCDYTYVTPSAALTSQSFDPNTLALVVDGTSIPTAGLTVNFGGAQCAAGATFTSTQISCTLNHAPRAGFHKAEIRDTNGLLPFISGSDIEVPLALSSVSPTSANALGGDILTIAGTGFPHDSALITVSLEGSDGISTGCQIVSLTETEIQCKVLRMSTEDGIDRTISVIVENPRDVTRRRLQSV